MTGGPPRRGVRRWGHGAALVAALLGTVSGAGCEEAPPGVRLIVTTDVHVPGMLDFVKVTVVGSRDGTGQALCWPTTLPAAAAGPDDFPIAVRIDKGSEYTAWVGFRVEGVLGGSAGTTVVRREVVIPWPEEGVMDVAVHLDARCVPAPVGCRDPLDIEQECIADESGSWCVETPMPGIFDTPMWIEFNAPDCFVRTE